MKKTQSIVAAMLGLACTFAVTSPSSAQEVTPIPQVQNPVSVQDTITNTIYNHKAIKALQENREAIGHQLDSYKREYGPRIDVNGSYGVGVLNNSNTRPLEHEDGWYPGSSVGATLTQMLWDGWATRSRVRETEATLNSMEYRVFDNATTYGLDALIAHVDVLRRREIYLLSVENVNNHEDILAQTRDRESLGADTMADVTQAESRLARAHSTLVEARTALRDAEETYFRLTGTRAPDGLAVVDTSPVLFGNTKEVLDQTLVSNPKILAFIEDINATKANEQLAKSAFHPTINLEAGPSYSDRGAYDSSWTYDFDVMGVMNWNVFRSGADVANTKAAQARIREARQTMNNFTDDVSQEIETTWNAWQSSKDLLQHYSDAVEFNKVTLEAYRDQFILGQRSLLDVLDAESELFNSSSQVITSRSNVVVGSYKLLAITGKFLPSLGISTAGLDLAPAELPSDSREKYN